MIKISEEFKNLIPPLSEEEYEQLEQNIIKEGCRDALVVWNRVILDGHNRYEICTKHGIDFDVYEMDFENEEDAKDWMDKNQLGRRNLTPDQRRIIIGRRYNREKRRQGTNNQYIQAKSESGQNVHFQTAEIIADESNVNEKSVRRYAKDAEFFDGIQEENPELAKKVWKGETTLRDIKNENKKKKRKEEIEEIQEKLRAEGVKPPDGKYDVIIIDPPWDYSERGGRSSNDYDPDKNRGQVSYPTLTVDELAKLELPIKDDCVLFLWTTHFFLHDSFHLLEKWGFKYSATLVWDKEKMGMGKNIRMQVEFCVLAKRGNPYLEGASERDIIREKRREHSRKPEEFYNKVKRMTAGRIIDFYGREKREGIDIYGAETDKFQ